MRSLNTGIGTGENSAWQTVPEELRALPQWVCWKLETVDGRATKIPYSTNGIKADSTDPKTWATFGACVQAHRNGEFSGIGFVFAKGGNLTGIDLDKHRDAATGELDPFASEYVSRLSSYTEISQSETGVHIIARATLPGDKGRRDPKRGVEMYSESRFFVMTGQHLGDTPRTVEKRQEAVAGMFREIFPTKEKQPATSAVPAQELAFTDQELVNKASQASNGAQFSALWRSNLAAAGYSSQSEADAALLSMLHFWTGGDKARSFRLFEQSGLNREKWNREDYRESTWKLVANGKTYQPPAQTDPPVPDDLEEIYGKPFFKGENGIVLAINERFFAAHFYARGNILYEPVERAFYSYNEKTGVWRRESDDAVREAVSASVLDYGRKAGLFLDPKISVARMNGIVHALRAIAERRDAFQKPRDFVHVQNGVVRFPASGKILLTDFSRGDFSRNRSPVAFNKEGECPQFINGLLRPALPDADVDLLQRWTGFAIAGVNPAQRFIILDGGPGTGKTQIAKVVQAIVGVENCTQLRTALLLERFEIFRFIGKTLLLAPDVPGDFLNRTGASQLKALVGSDPLTAEAKGSNGGFDLAGNFNVLIASNTRLRVRLDGDGGAWRRRLIILRFEQPPPKKRIPNFAEKLVVEEGAGILRWALAGLLRARQELAATGDLILTPTQQGRIDALLSESDSIRRFVAECTARGEGNVTSHELVEAYFHFCASNEWTPQPVRIVERTLADVILETHGASRAQDIGRGGKSVRGWRNVILITEAENVAA
jgi:putative DNA primase/helicase